MKRELKNIKKFAFVKRFDSDAVQAAIKILKNNGFTIQLEDTKIIITKDFKEIN